MNIEKIQKRMEEYWVKTTPEQLIEQFQKLGVEFVDTKDPKMTEDQFNDIVENIMTSTWEAGRLKIIALCKQMCDKQREICVIHAVAIERDYNDDWCIEEGSILNAPYPEELI